jgi:hypothetical protein
MAHSLGLSGSGLAGAGQQDRRKQSVVIVLFAVDCAGHQHQFLQTLTSHSSFAFTVLGCTCNFAASS